MARSPGEVGRFNKVPLLPLLFCSHESTSHTSARQLSEEFQFAMRRAQEVRAEPRLVKGPSGPTAALEERGPSPASEKRKRSSAPLQSAAFSTPASQARSKRAKSEVGSEEARANAPLCWEEGQIVCAKWNAMWWPARVHPLAHTAPPFCRSYSYHHICARHACDT
jgi:hypothetical protein